MDVGYRVYTMMAAARLVGSVLLLLAGSVRRVSAAAPGSSFGIAHKATCEWLLPARLLPQTILIVPTLPVLITLAPAPRCPMCPQGWIHLIRARLVHGLAKIGL